RQARKFRQELTANREWLPRLRTEAASVTASVAASEATPDSVPEATPAAGRRRGGAEGARQHPAGEAGGGPGEAAAMDLPGSLAAQAGTPWRVGPPPLWAGPPGLGVRTPALLGWREAEPRAMLFSWEAGALLQDLELPVDRE